MGDEPFCFLLDSINHLRPEHRGGVVVSGSHGGMYCACKCISGGVRGAILNDAGVGRDEAGVASLAACDPHLLPVAVVDHRSARIGDARDMLARGRVSRCNGAARALGVVPGMACSVAARLLRGGRPEFVPAAGVDEHRREIHLGDSSRKDGGRIVCIDSATLIRPEDAGRIVITGSHGGLIGGDPARAINVPARFVAFNDAGFGMEDAGAGRLAPLAERGIAAVVVDCFSARIGDGGSTLEDGVVSRANAVAEAAGFRAGMPLFRGLIAYLKEMP